MLPNILLVDDEEEILEFLERILQNKYTIFKTESGEKALKILEAEAIHLLFHLVYRNRDHIVQQLRGWLHCHLKK